MKVSRVLALLPKFGYASPLLAVAWLESAIPGGIRKRKCVPVQPICGPTIRQSLQDRAARRAMEATMADAEGA